MENRDTNAAAGNYFRFRCIFPPWDSMYAYFDINEHPESLRIFRQRGIRAKVVKTMAKKDVPYMIIVCRVPRRQSEAFSKAMEELESDLLLKGYTDYSEFCAGEVASCLEYVSQRK